MIIRDKNLFKHLKSEQGFGLLETTVAGAIGLIILFGITHIIVSTTKFSAISSSGANFGAMVTQVNTIMNTSSSCSRSGLVGLNIVPTIPANTPITLRLPAAGGALGPVYIQESAPIDSDNHRVIRFRTESMVSIGKDSTGINDVYLATIRLLTRFYKAKCPKDPTKTPPDCTGGVPRDIAGNFDPNSTEGLLRERSHDFRTYLVMSPANSVVDCYSASGGGGSGTLPNLQCADPTTEYITGVDLSTNTVTCTKFDPCSGDPVDRFIKRLYWKVLKRKATNTDLAYWQAAWILYLPGGQIAARNGVAYGFTASTEFRTYLIVKWFREFGRRDPTTSEINSIITGFESTQPGQPAGAFDYAEVRGRRIGGHAATVAFNGNNCTNIVNDQYRRLLYREATGGDRAFWVPLCTSNGAGYTGFQIANSQESYKKVVGGANSTATVPAVLNGTRVMGWYESYLNRGAEEEGLVAWTYTLTGGTPPAPIPPMGGPMSYGKTLSRVLSSDEFFDQCP